jgi:hypothetical protein
MLTPAILTGMTLVISTMEAFRSPRGAANVPKLLAPELYKAWHSAQPERMPVTELAGSPLQAACGADGVEGALLIDATSFFLSALIIASLRLHEELDKANVH